MKQITLRLKPGQYLREEIENIVQKENITAGAIISAVGGLENVNIRLSKLDTGEKIVKELVGPFELVSCMGTLSVNGSHIHVSVSDRSGACYGGHLKNGCEVFVTIELVILVFTDTSYTRVLDEETGFEELVSEKIK